MTDDFLSRDYADNHSHLSEQLGGAIDTVIETVRVSLDRLHHLEFDAPWQHDRQAR